MQLSASPSTSPTHTGTIGGSPAGSTVARWAEVGVGGAVKQRTSGVRERDHQPPPSLAPLPTIQATLANGLPLVSLLQLVRRAR
jgi:hypothetical protein